MIYMKQNRLWVSTKSICGILLAPALFIGHTYSPFRTLSGVVELGPYPLVTYMILKYCAAYFGN